MDAGLRRLTKQYSEERILLVTHGSVIRLLTMMTRTTSIKSTHVITRIDDFPPIVPNGSVVEIDIS
ncbi:histidine phosphatase family protein [Alicyclobacillus mengziensis]|uniref:Histidine phosphatase family protein n=1 Tax=Alicyclobacillus mengziensis TaxID=2931921 RepID=A0A9X7W389_9BACL|nr:histidine phosphatase family protein [Alicyclobacillus mengziensis]